MFDGTGKRGSSGGTFTARKQYVSSKSEQSKVRRVARLAEHRIGELAGPGEETQGERTDIEDTNLSQAREKLSSSQLSRFRKLAGTTVDNLSTTAMDKMSNAKNQH